MCIRDRGKTARRSPGTTQTQTSASAGADIYPGALTQMKALTMKPNKTQALLLLACLATASSAAWADGDTAEASAAAVSEKAAKKISKAIGEEVEDFVVTGQEEVEAPTGYNGKMCIRDSSCAIQSYTVSDFRPYALRQAVLDNNFQVPGDDLNVDT